jgi:hypothetical protein
MNNYEKERVRKQVTRLIRRKKLDGKRIVLFGASVFSKDILACLNEFGCSANAIVDNDSRKLGIRCLGMTVQKPEDVLMPFDGNNIILFYSPAFSWEIAGQLERMGYKKRRDIFVMNGKLSDSIVSFVGVTLHKYRGLWWYRKITRGHAPNCKIFIAPYTGTEKPVAGTSAVFFQLNQAIAFMDAAGYFIGVHSGLCDIISSSTCKKVILYEKDGLFYKSSQYEYFSLAKMGLCDDAVEVKYRGDLKDECLNEIFAAIK